MNNNQEKFKSLEEKNSSEINQAAAKQIEQLNDSLEKTVELSPRDIEARTEKAREEIALSVESKAKATEKTNNTNSGRNYRNKLSKKQLNESYRRTLKQTQDEMSFGGKVFSKVTHNQIIEKTSEFIGNTIARPNAMLAGAFFAFIATLVMYTVAKKSGYALSGFETIAAFIVGWLVGILYDYFRILFTGKKD